MSFICNLAAGSVWAEGVLKSGHLSPDAEENTGSSRDQLHALSASAARAPTLTVKNKSLRCRQVIFISIRLNSKYDKIKTRMKRRQRHPLGYVQGWHPLRCGRVRRHPSFGNPQINGFFLLELEAPAVLAPFTRMKASLQKAGRGQDFRCEGEMRHLVCGVKASLFCRGELVECP